MDLHPKFDEFYCNTLHKLQAFTFAYIHDCGQIQPVLKSPTRD